MKAQALGFSGGLESSPDLLKTGERFLPGLAVVVAGGMVDIRHIQEHALFDQAEPNGKDRICPDPIDLKMCC